jgi:hypothetical protein
MLSHTEEAPYLDAFENCSPCDLAGKIEAALDLARASGEVMELVRNQPRHGVNAWKLLGYNLFYYGGFHSMTECFVYPCGAVRWNY